MSNNKQTVWYIHEMKNEIFCETDAIGARPSSCNGVRAHRKDIDKEAKAPLRGGVLDVFTASGAERSLAKRGGVRRSEQNNQPKFFPKFPFPATF